MLFYFFLFYLVVFSFSENSITPFLYGPVSSPTQIHVQVAILLHLALTSFLQQFDSSSGFWPNLTTVNFFKAFPVEVKDRSLFSWCWNWKDTAFKPASVGGVLLREKGGRWEGMREKEGKRVISNLQSLRHPWNCSCFSKCLLWVLNTKN